MDKHPVCSVLKPWSLEAAPHNSEQEDSEMEKKSDFTQLCPLVQPECCI